MPLNGTVLAAALKPVIKTEIQAVFNVVDLTKLDQFATALSNAIGAKVVEHITANAVVNVMSVSGVTTGSGVSGPGVGTIT